MIFSEENINTQKITSWTESKKRGYKYLLKYMNDNIALVKKKVPKEIVKCDVLLLVFKKILDVVYRGNIDNN